ncbi:MAG: hypothetical protein LLP51_08995 [Halorhodospira halophila]|uniref:hypothetical protein n=1 Tax=Halorhodospira halophila TaxID=1053 RepID=UPI0026F11271|nr:hypothetical protein [Halorhodospira halophila]MCC3751519.1 hypothetical protein [Halorhodospira halophila]
MRKASPRIIGGCALVAAGALAASPAVAEHGFFFNYSHTPVYTALDSDVEDSDLSANAFEFGTSVTDELRAGVYHERLDGEGGNTANIQGISAEYGMLETGDFMGSVGFMVGNGRSDNGNSLVADIYGRAALLANDHANLNAKLAYRTVPDSDFAQDFDGVTPGDASDMHGFTLSVGFGVHF